MTIQLATAGACLCQISIPLIDISSARSPVRISGSVQLRKSITTPIWYTYQKDASVKDVSGKDIVLTVIHVLAYGPDAPGLDGTSVVDRFFSPDDLKAGKDEEMDRGEMTFGAPVTNGKVLDETGANPHPTATAELIFVEFADGSTWGDRKTGNQKLLVRAETLRELKKLGQILDEKGEPGLREELSHIELYQFPAIEELVNVCKNRTDQCLARGLRGMLKEAGQHEAQMKAAYKPTRLSAQR